MRAMSLHRLLACLLGIGVAGAAGAGRLTAADCNRNGSEDATDIAGGASKDCNANSVPDECDVAPGRFGFVLTQSASPAGRGTDGVLTDADADGDLDLLVVSVSPPEVRFQANEGGGGLGSARATPLGEAAARSAVLADLDGDRDVDAALAGAFGVTLFLRSEAGLFEEGATLPIGSDPVRIAAMHLNGDDLPEIVTVNSIGVSTAVNVSVLTNMGNGSFQAPRNYSAGSSPTVVVPADVDGDADPDIVLVHSDGERMSVLENDGTGSFPKRVPLELSLTERPHGVVAGSLDETSASDLVVTFPFQKVEVIFNPMVAAARRSVTIDVGMEGGAGWIGDLDKDGSGDIVLGGRFSSKLWVFLGRGKGVFKQDLPTDFPLPPFVVRPGDVDGDGDIDLVLPAAGSTWIALQGLVGATEDANSNGIPDECEGTPFVRGDVDANSAINLSDALVTLSELFQGGDPGPCADAADTDDDGKLDITDSLTILILLFQGGSVLPEPYLDCGPDPSEDALDCARFEACP